ncbi:UNVERIFIED_CONTAM: hypothetical protein GTU68_039581 [Idotea baltica]|nr:hypothetical protein [Idotea baltica]
MELRSALLDRKVIFFRDQDITTEQHLAFARNFGELEIHPFGSPDPEYPEIFRITHGPDTPGYENQWHSDVTWRLAPSLGSVLRMKTTPPAGGDTVFADMGAAYDGLPDEIKKEIDGKVARHDFDLFRRGLIKRGASAEEVAQFDSQYPNPHHPIVRTHPETGRRTLFVNTSFTREIVGMDPARSEQLLALLYQQASFPEYQCRFSWEPNSIAFWDNRSCQHYAISDYWPHARSVERATIIGDEPYFDPQQPVADDSDYDRFRGAIGRTIAKQAAALSSE